MDSVKLVNEKIERLKAEHEKLKERFEKLLVLLTDYMTAEDDGE